MNQKKKRHIKRHTIYAVLCVFVSLIFFASTGMTYASWRIGSSTVNSVSVGTVRGKIVGYDDPEQILSLDRSVEKEACIQNTGTLDACVRTKVEKSWGPSRDADGKLIVDKSLSADNIIIDYNADDWYYNERDGYYYYKGVITPDEVTSSLFRSFRVDCFVGAVLIYFCVIAIY